MKTKKETIIEGVKGFNKDLTCQGFQYKEGETFEMKVDPIRCEKGFHFCTEPLDVLRYYDPADSVFHKVEGYGKSSTDNDDSKVAVSKIKIGAKLNIAEFVKLSFEAILKRCKDNKIENSGDRSMASNSGDRSMASNSGYSSMASNSGDSSMASNSGYSAMASNSGYSSMASNSGDRSMASNSGDSSMASNSGYRSMASNSGYRSMASNSGDRSMASNSGDRSMASNSGYRSMAEVSGSNSIAIGFGIDNKAKASLGNWLCLSEWKFTDKWILKTVKTAKVDGKKLKADTFYKLENGKFIKA